MFHFVPDVCLMFLECIKVYCFLDPLEINRIPEEAGAM